MAEKKCTKCKKSKPLNVFGVHKRSKDGLNCWCKECVIEITHARFKTKEGLVSKIFFSQRRRSKKRGHSSPSYSLEELREWMFDQPNFDDLFNNWVMSGHSTSLIPSCDRKDDYKPYNLDNLQLMTWQENNDKGYSARKNGVNNKQSKPVIQMDKLGNFIGRYYSASKASRSTKIDLGSISDCCRRVRKSAGGFCWMFEIQLGVNHG